jgi:hypothetical protein
MNNNASQGQIHHSLRPFVLLATRWLLVRYSDSSGGQSGFSLSTSFHHSSPYSYITCGMTNRPVVGRSSKTYSYPNDMIINIHQLPSWWRVFLQNFKLNQVDKKLYFIWNPKNHYCAKNCYCYGVVSQKAFHTLRQFLIYCVFPSGL